MRFYCVLLFILASPFFWACATPSLGVRHPQAITEEKVDSVEKGVTTREDLNAMFGEPEMKVLSPDGVSYFYKDLNLNSFWALFNDDWTLRDYEWSN